MSYFTSKTQEFHMGCMTTTETALFLCPLTLSAWCNGANDSQADT